MQGKRVLITGGAKGIGRSLAENFFIAGATVFICSRNERDVQDTCREIDPEGKRMLGIPADVSVRQSCKDLVDTAVEKMGGIDVLINNAGIIGEVGEFIESDLSSWEDAITTNLLGTVYCTRYALAHMKEKGGKVINFAGAGVGSKNPLPQFSSYYTSKMAIVGFTETLAKEVAPHNIQVNCIAPGAINTGITDYILAQGEEKVGSSMYEKTKKQKENGGDSEEKIFELIAFLVSNDSRNVSGRLLSSKWDSIEILKTLTEGDLFKVRRIDNDLFYGK
jgi:NAD(P)-dependent dehydrogenase (short-subunit alcohol dehydrogenase family)